MASLGQALREEREARNISVEEIASSTKIVSRYLDALENDRLDQMPGGFFVRGIIRSYAKAIGLDPETVLNRYKEAGLLEPATPEKRIFPLLAPKSAPKAEISATTRPPATSATTRPAGPAELSATTRPAAPAESAGPAESVETPPPAPAAESPATSVLAPVAEAEPATEPAPPGGAESSPHAVHFDEAPKPRLPEALRKRVLAWTWRILAAALLVAVALILWPRRHENAIKAPTETAGPKAAAAQAPSATTRSAGPTELPETTGPAGEVKTDQPQAAPSGAVTAPPAQGEPGPAAPAAEVGEGLTIEITFQAETWIQVRTDGAIKIDGLFPPGATARARADSRLLIHTGNAGGFTFLLNGRPAKPLGRRGVVLTDIKITVENFKDFLESPSSGTPTG
jgi:cytoskeletal protein RodZ